MAVSKHDLIFVKSTVRRIKMKKRCNEQPQSAAEEVLSELPIES